jgi:hypothetical protein
MLYKNKIKPQHLLLISAGIIGSIGILLLVIIPRVTDILLIGDGNAYYFYMRSFWLDFDADFTNELLLAYQRSHVTGTLYDEGLLKMFSIGPGLLWSPFFLLGHGAGYIVQVMGFPVTLDGFSTIEQVFVLLGSLFYGILGLFFLYKWLNHYVSEKFSIIASMCIYLGSTLFNDFNFTVSSSHPVEFFSVTLFLWSLNRDNSKKSTWITVGFAAGIMAIVRWQNLIFGLVLLDRIYTLYKKNGSITDIAIKIGLMIPGFTALISIQFGFWKMMTGSLFIIPQGTSFFSPFNPAFFQVLFSSRKGLFTWTPLVFISLAGLIFLKDKKFRLVLFLIFILDVYACSITSDWWGGAAYGQRRLTGILPIAAMGLSLFIQYIFTNKNRIYQVTALSVISLTLLWNLLFIIQFRLRLIPADSYLTCRQLFTEKILLPGKITKLIKNKINP